MKVSFLPGATRVAPVITATGERFTLFVVIERVLSELSFKAVSNTTAETVYVPFFKTLVSYSNFTVLETELNSNVFFTPLIVISAFLSVFN